MRRNPFYLSLRAAETLRNKFQEEFLDVYSHHDRPYLTKLRDEDRYDPALVAGAAFDVDMYSSTRAALRVFQRSESSKTLPRAFLYFDEAVNSWINPQAGISEHVGIHAAIDEFNDTHVAPKIGQLEFAADEYLLTYLQLEKMFMYCDSEHPRYTDPWDKPASDGPGRGSG